VEPDDRYRPNPCLDTSLVTFAWYVLFCSQVYVEILCLSRDTGSIMAVAGYGLDAWVQFSALARDVSVLTVDGMTVGPSRLLSSGYFGLLAWW
jgi:hypothetical protein